MRAPSTGEASSGPTCAIRHWACSLVCRQFRLACPDVDAAPGRAPPLSLDPGTHVRHEPIGGVELDGVNLLRVLDDVQRRLRADHRGAPEPGGFASNRAGLGGGVLMLGVMATVLPPVAVIPLHGAIQFGTNLSRNVIIESADDDDVWGTVGVSENIIEASWKALVDSVEYKLYKDETQKKDE